jgi:hypothetical protein
MATPSDKTEPAEIYLLVSPSDSDLPNGPCRGLLVGGAGTGNLTQINGVEQDEVPLQAGYNPLSCRAVRSGGSATDIWALY